MGDLGLSATGRRRSDIGKARIRFEFACAQMGSVKTYVYDQNKNRKTNQPRKGRGLPPKSDGFHWLFPCVVACVLFVPALHFGFVFDDNTLIMSNPWVHSWAYLPKLLTSHLWAFRSSAVPILQYRPQPMSLESS